MVELKHPLGRIASRPSDYLKLSLDPTVIEPWEDSLRTQDVDAPGAYEWWWFDVITEDGTSVVVIFMTKPYEDRQAKLAPLLTITVTYPDGTIIDKEYQGTADEFYASKDSCEVKIKDSIFKGDLKTYEIEASIEDVSVSVKLERIVRSWRPLSGMMEFGPLDNPEGFLGWLPSIPAGKATGSYTVAGKKTQFINCSAYHDHNWGDIPLVDVVHHWYWARGTCGEYTVVAAYIVSAQKYELAPIMQFLLAKNGKVIAENADRVTFEPQDLFTDEKSGRPVANKTIYTFTQDNEQIQVVFDRKETIRWEKPSETGWYLRFKGKVSIKVMLDGEVTDSVSGPGLWELMYPGEPLPHIK